MKEIMRWSSLPCADNYQENVSTTQLAEKPAPLCMVETYFSAVSQNLQ
jgi:hypothetical protein